MAKGGEDEGAARRGRQAQGRRQPPPPRAARSSIPATAQLAYEAKDAKAEAGQLTIESPNPSGTPHNIALEGAGIDEKGEVVTDGGVSTVKATVKKGEYTFYCSVPGHREGGMLGKLTVE